MAPETFISQGGLSFIENYKGDWGMGVRGDGWGCLKSQTL